MTYLGMSKNRDHDFRTLVLAESDEEALKKVCGKFRAWWGGDYREQDVLVCAFGEKAPRLS